MCGPDESMSEPNDDKQQSEKSPKEVSHAMLKSDLPLILHKTTHTQNENGKFILQSLLQYIYSRHIVKEPNTKKCVIKGDDLCFLGPYDTMSIFHP